MAIESLLDVCKVGCVKRLRLHVLVFDARGNKGFGFDGWDRLKKENNR